MSNRKKLKAKDGATRIVPFKGELGRTAYKVQVYSKDRDEWADIEGCENLTYPLAQLARHNYAGLRDSVKIVNKCVVRAVLPNGGKDEDNGN